MGQKELQELFCAKITIEYDLYKKKVRKHSMGWVLKHVYEIELKARIYENLMEEASDMEIDMLRILLVLPDVIHMFYRRWMKYKDSSQKEITACINMTIESISMKYIGIGADMENRSIGQSAA